MDSVLGWIVFLAVAAILLRPLFHGFFAGLRGEDEESQKEFAATRGYSGEVVGESHYQRNLLKIAGGKAPEGVEIFVEAKLVLEDANPHDKHAVRVDIAGLTVGYLPRDRAFAWRAGRPPLNYSCRAVIRGGWDRGGQDQGNFGVWLDLPRP
jgi:hypothetical protein